MSNNLLEKIEKIEDELAILRKKNEEKDEKIRELEKEIREGKEEFRKHSHSKKELTEMVKGDIELPNLGYFSSGNTAFVGTIADIGTINERIYQVFLSGLDKGKGMRKKSSNSQITTEHQEKLQETFVYGYRPPLYLGKGVNIVSGTSILSQNDWKWQENEMIGTLGTSTYVAVWDSNNTFKQCNKIISNTENSLTIEGTWGFTDSNSTYFIWKPIYFGAALFPFKRLYTMENAEGGIRFGPGPTGGGQNGLLYMKSSNGKLYWRGTDNVEREIRFV